MNRTTLLNRNAGVWEGTFIRLDGNGLETERFDSHLEVADHHGMVDAALTNLSSGQVRNMRFRDPPPEMQITTAGHWSLGPDRIGPWPWVSELCLTHHDQRRRAVIRLGIDRLESLVVVIEGRPDHRDWAPPPPLRSSARPDPDDAHRLVWEVVPGLEVTTMAVRTSGSPQSVGLRWRPEPGVQLELTRSHGAAGLLLPLQP